MESILFPNFEVGRDVRQYLVEQVPKSAPPPPGSSETLWGSEMGLCSSAGEASALCSTREASCYSCQVEFLLDYLLL